LHSTAHLGNRTFIGLIHHGKSQEEASPQDEQAQAQKALEVESPQKAYVAEVNQTRRIPRRVFRLNKG
jgi:hypothetical protein